MYYNRSGKHASVTVDIQSNPILDYGPILDAIPNGFGEIRVGRVSVGLWSPHYWRLGYRRDLAGNGRLELGPVDFAWPWREA